MKISSFLAALALLLTVQTAPAAEPLKIGVIAEMSGLQSEYGLQITNGMKLYMKEHGDTVAGRKIELLIRDVGGANPDVSKRLAQELVTRDKVEILAGFGFTPNAMAAAPVATQARIPMVVMNAASSSITTKSPYIVRTSMTIPQNAMGMADWAAKNGMKKIFILYADYGPGKDGAEQFRKTFTAAGGEIVGEVGVPLKNPEFAPYMLKLRDAKPDAAFLWVPSGELANNLFRSYKERGLDKAGIRMIGTSDAVDDMFLQAMGDAVVGTVTAGHYSVAHDSDKNRAFIKEYRELFGTSMSPNFMAVGGYDGMAAIYEVVRKLNGKIDGEKAMEVLKGMAWESPRGPISIDPETRDIVQTVYIRRVERQGEELVNAEFAELKNVKDPGK